MFDPTTDIREPLTITLGIPIFAQSTPSFEGTGGFFIVEGERLLLVTARHAVLAPHVHANTHFERKSDSQQPCHDVALFSDAALTRYIDSIKTNIRSKAIMAPYHESKIRKFDGRDDAAANEGRQCAQSEMDEAREAMEKISTFYQEVLTHWSAPESRALGHVVLSPPITVGVEGYTEDWAVIEVDPSKLAASDFKGNAIDLGTRIPFPDLHRMMSCPDDVLPFTVGPGDDGSSTVTSLNAHAFEYPVDRLLRLEGTIPDKEMRRPTLLTQDDEPYLMVLQRGSATGLTVGRANDVCSCARMNTHETSKEWAILPFNDRLSGFSVVGDSGAVVVDGRGRIGGLITGGAGVSKHNSELDVTYATPVGFLLAWMRENGLCVDAVLTHSSD